MKSKIEPINLVCDNDELNDINIYHLRDNLYKVRDTNSKLSFCFIPNKMNVQTVLNSNLLNDKKFYSKLVNTNVIEKKTNKNDSYYTALLISKISYLITYVEDHYNIIQE